LFEVPGLRYRLPEKEQPAAASSKGARMCARQAEGGAFVDPAANRMPHFPRLGPAAFQAEAGRGGAHAVPPVTGRRAARLGAAEEAGDSHRILRSCSLTLTPPTPPSPTISSTPTQHQHQLAAKPPALHRPTRERNPPPPLLLQYISPSLAHDPITIRGAVRLRIQLWIRSVWPGSTL
jgi:hypothetical protein